MALENGAAEPAGDERLDAADSGDDSAVRTAAEREDSDEASQGRRDSNEAAAERRNSAVRASPERKDSDEVAAERRDSAIRAFPERKDSDEPASERRDSGTKERRDYSAPRAARSRPTTAATWRGQEEEHVFKDGTRVPKFWYDRYTRRPRTSRSFHSVEDEEAQEIVERVARPTVSWTGGAALRDKEFCYILPPVTKTNPRVPRLERFRRLKNRRLPSEELSAVVERLYSRHTAAWKANISPNPHSRFA